MIELKNESDDKMKLKHIPYLVYDSLKSLVRELVELAASLKKAKTWSFILYATFFLAVYYEKYNIMKIALPLILILYIVRRQKEPEFNTALKGRAFLNNIDSETQLYYEQYKKQTSFVFPRRESLSYEEYKREEIEKLKEKIYVQ